MFYTLQHELILGFFKASEYFPLTLNSYRVELHFFFCVFARHKTNYSTKAILCNIIQFQVAIPFPRYHSASDGTVTSSAMISV